MKITMPDPAAHFLVDSESGTFFQVAPEYTKDEDVFGLYGDLQMEAYANERIMAVLKEVAEIADDNNDFKTFDAVLDMIDGFGMKK